MFRLLSLFTFAALFGGAAFAQDAAAPAAAAPQFKSLEEKVSYIVGLNIGRGLKNDGMEVTPDLVIRGLRDALAGTKYALTDEEITSVIQEFSKQQMAKEAQKALAANPELKAMAEKNSAEGAAFHAENGKKEGIVTLPSGLQYKVLTAGAGATPKLTDTVQAHYSGKLLNGTVFDSSYERGQPTSFSVDGVIPGWTEALQKNEGRRQVGSFHSGQPGLRRRRSAARRNRSKRDARVYDGTDRRRAVVAGPESEVTEPLP